MFFFRVFIAFIILGGLKFVKKKDRITKKLSFKEYLILSMSGLFIALNWFFFFRAIKATTIASATMSYYVAPVIVTILSVFLLKESINKKTLIAVGLSFSGVILMTVMGSQEESDFNIIGVGYGLIAAFFLCISNNQCKKTKKYSII